MNQSYGRLVSRAAIAATAMASLLLLIKIFAWWYTGSVSILAALVDSLVDIGASLTNLLVVRYSLQPADDNHSFGHGKAESLAALAQSMFISGSALFLFLTGIQHLISPTPMTDPGVGVIVTIVALICTIILVSFQRWVVRRTQSQAVRADMLHYQSDVMMNGAILLALGLSWYGWHRADALFALGIGIYILYSALRMGYEAVQSLLDRALPDEERQEIIDIVTSWPGVSGAHDLRTRQSGPTRFIQIHLEMEDNLPLVQAHVIADQVEQAILRQDGGVNADQLTVEVHQRAAGVPAVNRRIGLDKVFVVFHVQAATAQRGDNPGGHGFAQTKRVTDSHGVVADAQRIRISQLNRRQVFRILNLNQRDIGARIFAHDFGIKLTAIAQLNLNRGGVVHNVVVGHHIPFGRINDDAGAQRHKFLLLAAVRLTALSTALAKR